MGYFPGVGTCSKKAPERGQALVACAFHERPLGGASRHYSHRRRHRLLSLAARGATGSQ